jgi:iron complex transport system substrate-binding protein
MRAMRVERAFAAILLIFFGSCAGCDRKQSGTSRQDSSAAKAPRVVSLVPSASDIIEGIGAGDHLAAVSNYDTDPRTAGLPRVGDYMNTDWERIAPLHPAVVITEYAEGRTPQGFSQRLAAIGATQVNIHTHRLDDIYATILQLGDACGEHDKGVAGQTKLKEQIESVRQRVASEPKVPALIVLGPAATSVAGPDTFLDDLLNAAGGKNAAEGLGPYPTIDREQLVSRSPQVIIQLLPAAGPQVIAQAQQAWAEMPQVPAVKDGRVVRLTEWYVMHPGFEVGTLAQQFATILHPQLFPPSTMPVTAPSGPGTPAR